MSMNEPARYLCTMALVSITLACRSQDRGIAGTIALLDQPSDSIDAALLTFGWSHGMYRHTNQYEGRNAMNVPYWMRHYHKGKKNRIMIYTKDSTTTAGIVAEDFPWKLPWPSFRKTLKRMGFVRAEWHGGKTWVHEERGICVVTWSDWRMRVVLVDHRTQRD